MSLIKSRQALRQSMRAKRAQISLIEREQAGRDAADVFIVSDMFRKAQHIACYFSIPAEFETKFIIEAIWKENKNCYLPLLSQEEDHRLYFAKYSPETSLKNNHCHIPEPVYDIDTFISPETFDLVFVPLVAFDRSGNRLGTGGGCYDRTFAFKVRNLRCLQRSQRRWGVQRGTMQCSPLCAVRAGFPRRRNQFGKQSRSLAAELLKNTLPGKSKPLLCGLGFASQEINFIKPESWDVTLDAILTEKELIQPF